MTHFAFAAHSHIRNVVLCALATLTLAACGGEDGSSGSAATSAATGSDSVASLVSPNTGVIDRSTEVAAPGSAGTAASGPQTAATTPSTPSSSSTTTPASGSTTVGSTTKGTTPVKTTTGVATLDWMPPTENSDGSVLTNLAGYTVYYGTSPSNLTQTVKVTNPGLTAYTVTDLSSGIWYFAVTAYSSTGVESTRTGTVSATI
jgi:hypothetical protein